METGELLERLERGERDRRPVEVGGLRFTHLERELWPAQGLTKGDLVRYYVRVSAVMVPYLEGRPLMLKRYPEGVMGKPFVQQRVKRPVPDVVRTAVVPVAEGKPTERYIGSGPTLWYAAQMSAVEVHAWQSRLAVADRPDWVVLDLDPSKGAGFRKVVRVAHRLRERIEALGLVVGVKTTGSRGLHLYVPTGGRVGYEEAAEFARRVAEGVAEAEPRDATVIRAVERRGYRVYVDHLQNARGKTAVVPYSVRARLGAPVSMPIRWEEVDDALDPRAFRMADVPAVLEREGDAWAGWFDRSGGRFVKALEALRGAEHRRSA